MSVAVTGAGLAWLWFHHLAWLAVLVGVVGVFAGKGVDWIGRLFLPAKPTVAISFMEWWLLTPAVIAAIAAAVVVMVTVALTVPDGTPASTKETIGALSTGLTSFLTASLISWTSDDADDRAGDHISEAFQAAYQQDDTQHRVGDIQYFPPGSPGLRWVYSDEYEGIAGWGRSARGKRAKGIEAAMTASG
jgi:hypothetical protein